MYFQLKALVLSVFNGLSNCLVTCPHAVTCQGTFFQAELIFLKRMAEYSIVWVCRY